MRKNYAKKVLVIALIAATITSSTQIVQAKGGQYFLEIPWDDPDKREEARTVYEMTEWYDMEDMLTYETSITETMATALSGSVERLEDDILEIMEGKYPGSRYDTKDYAQFVLAVIQCFNGGEVIDSTDPARIKAYINKDAEITSKQESLEYLIETIMNRERISKGADIKKADTALASFVQGLIMGPDYYRLNPEYSAEEAANYYETYPERYRGAEEPNFNLGATVFNHYTVVSRGGVENVVYFNQWDSQWRHLRYGTSTIGIAGCGPTSLAIVISTLTGSTVNPLTMANWSVNHGYYVAGAGSAHALIPAGAKAYGLNVSGCKAYEGERIKNALRDGKMVIVIMGPGIFTTGGHFLVLSGITAEGKIKMADPASRNNSLTEWDIGTITSQARTYAGAGGPFWIIG